jgi:hypothetical protein
MLIKAEIACIIRVPRVLITYIPIRKHQPLYDIISVFRTDNQRNAGQRIYWLTLRYAGEVVVVCNSLNTGPSIILLQGPTADQVHHYQH